MIDSPLESQGRFVELFLGPSTNKSCFTITAIDDDSPETPTKNYQFLLSFNVEETRFQVSRSTFVSVDVLDDDCKSKLSKA